ncbi:MAG: methyltransferase domain-containing protein [Clostridia bacterium]|nr:methyltransferase domain-containing protein [Clostridia bacterium]
MAYDTFARFYDSLTDNVEYEKRAAFVCRLLSFCGIPNGILLELGCGTGSLTALLADRGYDVIGVDTSVGMLNAAREKCAPLGSRVLLLQQDMQALDLFGTVRACVCALDGLNHLPDAAAVRRTFAGVSLFMEPGGAFIFDVNTVYKHRAVLADNAFVIENDDVFCTWQNALQPDDSVEITLDFFEEAADGTYERSWEQFTERAYPLPEIAAWLEEAGFEVCGIYDDLNDAPAGETTERATFLARKKAAQ